MHFKNVSLYRQKIKIAAKIIKIELCIMDIILLVMVRISDGSSNFDS